MSRGWLFFGSLSGALLLATSCESNPPDIVALDLTTYQLTDRELGTTYEVLSLFVSAGDLDGLDDLDRLYLIHDDAELFWSTHSEVWVQMESEDGLWIGEPRLAMPDRGAFPAGTYRVVLVDLAGESTERELSLPRDRTSPLAAAVALNGSRARIAGSGAHELWLSNADGLVGVATLDGDGEIDLAEVAPSAWQNATYELYVITRAAAHQSEAMIGPYGWSSSHAADARN